MDPSQIQGLAARVAAQQEITRADLATWDASARAWLLSADEVQKVNLTQLRLIIKDCGLLASSLGATYSSVIDVWAVAMKTLQDLILGRPQRISKGALLIGLSSWHIYPDLNVVGPIAHVKFADNLVEKGEIVTLGLQSSSPQEDFGVQWSLSLSHLRYYGTPLAISTTSGANGSRISMEELHLVVLGSTLGAWGHCVTNLEKGAELVVAILSKLEYEKEDEFAREFPGLHLLWRSAKHFLGISSEMERESALCLISYGRRRAQNFLIKASSTLPPAFGLGDPYALISIPFDNPRSNITIAEEVKNLRTLAQLSGCSSGECIIRYCIDPEAIEGVNPGPQMKKSMAIEYTTAIPFTKGRPKRGRGGKLRSTPTHTRWLCQTLESWIKTVPMTEIATDCQTYDQRNLTYYQVVKWKNPPEPFRHLGHNADQFSATFQYFAGNTQRACLLISRPAPFTKKILLDHEITDHLTGSSPISQGLRRLLLRPYYETFISDSNDSDIDSSVLHSSSLKNLACATSLYRQLPGATVSISVVRCPMYDVSCCKTLSTELAAMFACIAMFETGSNTVQAEQLKPVMALSSGNSIYVANALLQDPIEPNSPGPQGITRIVGNLGRPGVVMMAPPQAPLVRGEDPDSWRVINHSAFNGKPKKCFPETTLHLSFTKYEVPLSVPIGAVDAEISMVETLVSVHDRKQWIADLDIIASLKCESFLGRLRPPRCNHTDYVARPSMEFAAVQIGNATVRSLVSIDSWEELLDPPENLGHTNIGVLRACNNWHARLAAMSVSVQQQLRTVVLPTEPLCTVCGAGAFQNMADFAQILIL